MKKSSLFIWILFSIVIFTGCKSSAEKEKQKATELISTKTLGLAYLEEFKLDEAEKEFLKFIDLAPTEKFGYANLGLTYLRMAKYPEAEKQLARSIEIDPNDPDVRLILATVYQMEDEIDKAIAELQSALKTSPGHVKVLYDLSELYGNRADSASQRQYAFYTQKLLESAPANLVPRLKLTDILIRTGKYDEAIEQLETIHKQFPEFPREAVEYFNKTISYLRKKEVEKAVTSFTIFHNYLKVTSPYQAGITDLKGPGGSLIGFPLISFDQQTAVPMDSKSLLDVIHFNEVSGTAGLQMVPIFTNEANFHTTRVVTGDYDGDGDVDLYVSCFDQAAHQFSHFLLNNEMGAFRDVAKEAGLNHAGRDYATLFADLDNDGFLDLYIVHEGGTILYRNTGKGKFEDVTKNSGLNDKTPVNSALAFDADHDGDLDIFEAKQDKNLFFRNNADGTFLEQADIMGLSGNGGNSMDAAFGDLDEDADIDFVVGNADKDAMLYSNQRQGKFIDIADTCGLDKAAGSVAVCVADYDNDGFLDLFLASSRGEQSALYHNLNNGKYEKNSQSTGIFRALGQVKINDASFFDFDNDGRTDLFIAGESDLTAGRGLFLFHNEGKGNFRDVSSLLPENLQSGDHVSIMDYNDDGDEDIVMCGINGGIKLLRNDGGNNNHFIKMKLVGLRAGSAKNNYFGIGAKVEMRAGDLYQTLVVTDPNVHFGMGSHLKADVIRITWTNGVPQNIFFPGTDQSFIESQTLKGSCPFLYTWNGEKYEFVKDIMWRSALGMPLGIMGGTTAYAFSDASDDYLKVPGEKLKPENGRYSLQVTAELWETIYFDQVQLVSVDHPDSTDIFVPEQFSPPPFPGMKVFVTGRKHFPVSAIDDKGNNVLDLVQQKDNRYVSGFEPGKYQGTTEMHDLVLDLGPLQGNAKLYLFLNGWIFPTDASINFALAQSSKLQVQRPVIQVINMKGNWETVSEPGFPMGKNKTVVADLSGIFKSSDHRIRIRTNMEIYWDQIFYADCLSEKELVSTVLDPLSADLHYRGFSEGYRKGGRYGPHWFDYAKVSKDPKWRDLVGNYTRYGNVLPLLQASDNRYIITNAGDETTISFNAASLPVLPQGWKRDFLIRSVGWVKDGDLNTAYGKTVLPLPYHGMKGYPPAEGDKFPVTHEWQKYNSEYNTRVVTAETYQNSVKGK